MKKSVKKKGSKNPNFNRNSLIGIVILILIFVVAFNFAGKGSDEEGLSNFFLLSPFDDPANYGEPPQDSPSTQIKNLEYQIFMIQIVKDFWEEDLKTNPDALEEFKIAYEEEEELRFQIYKNLEKLCKQANANWHEKKILEINLHVRECLCSGNKILIGNEIFGYKNCNSNKPSCITYKNKENCEKNSDDASKSKKCTWVESKMKLGVIIQEECVSKPEEENLGVKP
jgi:hypothetical protein